MQLFGLASAWDENAYRALLTAARSRGGYCVLILRRGSSQDCLAWVENRSADIESEKETMRWPGTVACDPADKVTLIKFRITSELVDSLQSVAASPFDWLGPELPEDLSFLRPDGRPWFVSIAHERDAFFKLGAEEPTPLRKLRGSIELVAQGDDQAPEERY